MTRIVMVGLLAFGLSVMTAAAQTPLRKAPAAPQTSVSAPVNLNTATTCMRPRVVHASADTYACPFVDLPHHRPYRTRHPWDRRITAEEMASIRWASPSVVIEVAYLGWARHSHLGGLSPEQFEVAHKPR